MTGIVGLRADVTARAELHRIAYVVGKRVVPLSLPLEALRSGRTLWPWRSHGPCEARWSEWAWWPNHRRDHTWEQLNIRGWTAQGGRRSHVDLISSDETGSQTGKSDFGGHATDFDNRTDCGYGRRVRRPWNAGRHGRFDRAQSGGQDGDRVPWKDGIRTVNFLTCSIHAKNPGILGEDHDCERRTCPGRGLDFHVDGTDVRELERNLSIDLIRRNK
jgi:hypothetical protein